MLQAWTAARVGAEPRQVRTSGRVSRRKPLPAEWHDDGSFHLGGGGACGGGYEGGLPVGEEALLLLLGRARAGSGEGEDAPPGGWLLPPPAAAPAPAHPHPPPPPPPPPQQQQRAAPPQPKKGAPAPASAKGETAADLDSFDVVRLFHPAASRK
jgi:hypothetical protein